MNKTTTNQPSSLLQPQSDPEVALASTGNFGPLRLKPRTRLYLYLLLLVIGFTGLIVLPPVGKIGAISLLIGATASLLPLETLLLVTLALIPLHGAMMLFVFDLNPASDLRALRVAQAWKELLVAAIIGRIFWQRWREYGSWQKLIAALKPGPDKKLFNFLDLAVLFFIAINLFFLVIVPTPFTLYTRLQSVRYQIFFLTLYLVGRLILPSVRLKSRLIGVCLWAGGVTAAGAIGERFLSLEQFSRDLRAADYFTALFGAGAFAKDIKTDLPAFFTNSCGFQRSGSFMLAPLDVAHQFLLVIVVGLVTLVSYYQYKAAKVANWRTLGLLALVVLMGLGLALAYSRAAIVLILFELMLVSFLLARGKWKFILPPAILFTALGLLVLSLNLGGINWRNCVADTISGRESSINEHRIALDESIRATIFNPFGFGVASSGNYVSGNSDYSGIGGESAYAITSVQLGILGLVGLVGLVFGAILFWFFYLREPSYPDKSVAVIGLVYFSAMAILMLSTQPWVFGFATWMAWLLTGLSVSRSLKLSQPETQAITEE